MSVIFGAVPNVRILATAVVLLAAGAAPATADEPVVLCDGRPATIVGTPGDDKLIGDASDDVIVGLGGNDTLVGKGGNDTICGFDGDDTLIGGPGDDILLGGRGSDWLDYRATYLGIEVDLGAGTAEGQGSDTLHSIENVYGSGRHNVIYGSAAANTIVVDGDGDDILWGRGGDDILEAGHSYAELRGGAGDDHLSGTLRPYNPFRRDGAMHGGPGNDLIETYNSDTITGAAGDDHIRILDGRPTVHPGAGDDIIEEADGVADVSYWHAPGPIEVDLATGFATGWGVDQLVGVTNVYGSRFDDLMRGGPQGGRLYGSGGDDVLEAANQDHPQQVTLRGGRGNDILRGGAGADFIDGGPGSDVVRGFGGDDRLWGGEGRDDVDGGEGNDTISFIDLPGPMIINLSTSKAFGPGADVFANIEGIRGSLGDDHITGTMGPNSISGGFGDDIIYGRGGDDSLHGDTGDDEVYGGFGADRVDGDSGRDLLYGGAGADTMRGGSHADVMYGGQGDDTLHGGGGNSNTLDGGPQSDTCENGTTYVSCELIL